MKAQRESGSRKLRMLAVVLAASAAAAPRCAAQAETHKADGRLTAEQALNLRSLSDPRFSPDGNRVAFTVTEPPKGTARASHIWVLNVATHELRQFTNSAKSENSPRWSPDGKQLAFLSDREEFRQIYMMPADGGEAERRTEGKRNIASLEWSPNGKQIPFLAPEPKSDVEEKKEKEKDDARVVDRDEKLTRLWLLDAASGKVHQLTAGRWRVSEAHWLPGGDRLVISATDHPGSDEETNRIYLVEAADGEMNELAAPRGPFGRLRVSPDGKALAYVAARVDGPNPHDLYLQPIEGGASRNLTGSALDRPVESYLWRADGTLLELAQSGFKTEFVSIGTDGATKPAASLPVNPRAFDVSRSGALAFVGVSATEPDELWLRVGLGPGERVSKFNESWRALTLAKPEFFHYKSLDGLTIEGALLKPPDHQPAAKVPLVVLVHGGPTGAWSDSLEIWGQLLAAHGFAAFYPNIRGSTGYGWGFLEMNRGDWGGGDFRDVMAGVDYLVAQGIADPNRLGIGGWSYGGYMAEWAITQTGRFKAAVSGAGMANLASEFGTEAHPAYDEWFYGVPYEKLDGFMKSSPVAFLKNARTPTLILQGEADLTDPLGQSQELYRGLKHYGVETELVIYPREGHGLREEKHLRDRLNRIVGWYEGHLE